MDFRYNFGMKWSRGGVSVEKYVQGFQGFMQTTPLRMVPLGGHSLRMWSGSEAAER